MSSEPEGLASPKQPSPTRKRDWYPYYAGFTEEFVQGVIAEYLADADAVLDPWSGSGTTAVVAARAGISSVGIDINPALTVIARARIAPCDSRDENLELLEQILGRAATLDPHPRSIDPLRRWMKADAVARVRAVQEAIHLTVRDSIPMPVCGSVVAEVDRLSPSVCLFYTALFGAMRHLLRRFRATNPMWLKDPPTYRNKLGTSWRSLETLCRQEFAFLQDRLTLDSTSHAAVEVGLETGSATSLRFPYRHFGGVLTSPPYATRIDYVKGTLPELAVLGADNTLLASLRQATTGTPVVAGRPEGQSSTEIVSRYGRAVREAIEQHPSKGSKHYYVPWIHNYMLGLQAGLAEAVRTVVPEGRICVVVQDSYYKAFHIDTQRIVTETLEALGRPLAGRTNFPASAALSRMNPRAARYLKTRKNVESLLVFE